MFFAQVKYPLLTVLFTLALLFQLGPTATTTVTTTPSGTATAGVGAATPEAAVQTLLSSFTTQGSTSATCKAVSGQFQACPITARLLARLQSATENGNIIIRSQNPPQNLTVNMVDNNDQTAHVNAVFQSGTSSYTISFVVIKSSEGWQVDDSFCASQPNTSIFNAPTGPCPADTNTGTGGTPTAAGTGATPVSNATATAVVPGIPNTGNADTNNIALVLASLATLAAISGLLILLRTRTNRR